MVYLRRLGALRSCMNGPEWNPILRITYISILTDQGSNFLSTLFKDVCKILKIKKIQCTAFHPETNGSLERSHRTLGEYLRNYSIKDPLNWDTWIPFSMFVYNTSIHCTTGFTPYELIFGHKAVLPTSLTHYVDINYNYDDYAKDLKYRFQTSHRIAYENIKKKKIIRKLSYDKGTRSHSFRVGDLVLLTNEAKGNRKLKSLFVGPYKIIRVDSGENVTIRVGNSRKRVHCNRLRPFYCR